jgi:translation elongation factor EF-1alpha
MDTHGWDEARYQQVVEQIKAFLAQIGYKVDKKVTFVPVSGITGANLTSRVSADEAAVAGAGWYRGPSLLEALDALPRKVKAIEVDGGRTALRICVHDVYRSRGVGGLAVSGKVEAGAVAVGEC